MSARGAAGLALSCAQPLPEGVAAQREIARFSCTDALANWARKAESAESEARAMSVGLKPSVGSWPVGFITKFTFDVAVTNGTMTLSEMRFVRPSSSENGEERMLSCTCTRDAPSDAMNPGKPTSERM